MIAMAVTSAVAAIGSGVMSYMQGSAQANMARQQASYAQAMAARNQQLAQMAADRQRAKGNYDASLIRDRARRNMSSQIALLGGSGVDLTGSPLEVIGDTQKQYEQDALQTLHNAYYDAWRIETSGDTSLISGNADASRYNASAGFDQSRGMWGLAMSPVAAGTSILTNYNYMKQADRRVTPNPTVPGSGQP
jgi:hypothetical protein